MSVDTWFQFLCIVAAIGFFAGLVWSCIAFRGPFSGGSFIVRFLGGAVAVGPCVAFYAGAVYSAIWGAVRAIYFGLTGQ